MELNHLPMIVVAAVMICWFTLAGVFMFRKKPPPVREEKRARISVFGIALQGLGYAMVWSVQRQRFTPIVAWPAPLQIVIATFTVMLAIGSVWLVVASVRTLGRQWTFAARLVSEHKLITEGPYRFVRHPIYTGMFGMLLATGLAVSHWTILLPAVAVFAVGAVVRIRSEEKLLREAFGAEFSAYASRVPAFIPRVF